MAVRQRVRYRLPDGTISASVADAVELTEDEVLAVARPVCRSIPPGFLLGMAIRETDRRDNEIDTDIKGGKDADTTYGLLQVGPDELRKAIQLGAKLAPDADLCDPTVNLTVAVTVLEQRMRLIMSVGEQDTANRDTWLYLAWAHNAGVGEPLKSIREYGMDWGALLDRDDNKAPGYMRDRLIPYATFIADMAERYPV